MVNILRAYSVVGIVALFGLLSSPSALAQGLVPCGTNANPEMCTLCDLIVGIDGIIDYVLAILGFVGFLMLVVAGIMYLVSGGNQSLVGAAKKAIFAGLAGFAIVLLAWVVINTVIIYLLPVSEENNIGIKVNGWSNFSCDGS